MKYGKDTINYKYRGYLTLYAANEYVCDAIRCDLRCRTDKDEQTTGLYSARAAYIFAHLSPCLIGPCNI